jgi:pyruvate formate lyase activating enzyme
MTPSEVMAEVEKDLPFFAESGGGVTFSGGEPLMQPDFLLELLQMCQKRGIHTAVDTCGFTEFEDLARITPFVDLFLYDLKFIDDEKHLQHTGVSNQRILENLRKLVQEHSNVIIRVPLIPGINDTSADLQALEAFLLSLESVQVVSLLPYHKAGVAKAKRLKRPAPPSFQTERPTTDQVDLFVQSLKKHGFDVQVGG